MDTTLVSILNSLTLGHVLLGVGIWFVLRIATWVLEDSTRRREVERWREDK